MFFKRILIALVFFPFILLAQQVSREVKSSDVKIISAPVVLNLDTLFSIENKSTGYPVELRAKEISERLKALTDNYNTLTDSIYLRNKDEFIEVMYNNDLAFMVTPNDAKLSGLPIMKLAALRMESVKEAIQINDALTTKEWLIRLGYFVLSVILLIAFIKLVNWFFRKLNTRLSKIEKTFLKKRKNILKYFIPNNTANIFVFISNIIRIVIIVLFLIVYLPFVFSFFPWAERLVDVFYGYISTPIKYVVFGFINFIPSLFFIIIIAFIARYVVRVVREVSEDVELGKLTINNFHKDWAKPTGNIFSIMIYALALILIFPYLPGSGSTAFQGVSIFIGAIISFGSTSAIANIIAGIVITYMRPFQMGDRVMIDNIVGDVIEKTSLVTRIRTSKLEEVTIPNANILTGNIINYSKEEESSIVLYTTVTLGYDLPWKTANKLLLEAADRTQLVKKNPQPFVLQTSLDDYYVSYELNVHTTESKKMPFIYSEIHKNILEVFDEAGVEILSPSYQANRDGNLTTIPSQVNPEAKSPLNKLVDHLTGRNQKITITKTDGEGK